MHNANQIVVEATKRIKADEAVIFLDRTPKGLYEYHLNGYKPEDILTLADNIRMEFEAWDRMYNFYQSSKGIMELSAGDIAVLYEDYQHNLFIYSFATKKIYFYNKDVAPYINLNEAMSITDFLDFARRDYEGLLRTPYGKKYVTESTVVIEGLKEFFGLGKALRIKIDGKETKDQKAFDKHSYAFIDALLCYSSNLISDNDYDKMCRRNTSVAEIYDNSKLGQRDSLRRMDVKETAMDQTVVKSLADLMVEYEQDPEDIYDKYFKARYAINVLLEAIPDIVKYCKKNSLTSAVRYCTNTGTLKPANIDMIIKAFNNDPMILVDRLIYSDPTFLTFDESVFRSSYIAKIRNRLEKLSNSDLHVKFEYHMTSIINIISAHDKKHVLNPHYYFDNDKSSCERDANAICKLKITYDPYVESGYRPASPDKQTKQLAADMDSVSGIIINKVLFEFLTNDKKEYTDGYIKYIVQEANYNIDVTNNTISVALERELGREIAHKAREIGEKVVKVASDATHNIRNAAKNMMDKVQDVMDDIQKAGEERDREIAITNSAFLKFRRFFTQSIIPTAGAYILFGPAKAIITFLTTRALKSDDEKAKNAVIRELEIELKLTREKIDDARSEGNKQAKYQLMRLESDIENNIAKIKYGVN